MYQIGYADPLLRFSDIYTDRKIATVSLSDFVIFGTQIVISSSFPIYRLRFNSRNGLTQMNILNQVSALPIGSTSIQFKVQLFSATNKRTVLINKHFYQVFISTNKPTRCQPCSGNNERHNHFQTVCSRSVGSVPNLKPLRVPGSIPVGAL